MALPRLTLLLVCLGLTASRCGLILHEVVGHGGVAAALGGHVREITLFWFGGGWVKTATPDASRAAALAIQLGGIAVELLAGALLLLAARQLDSRTAAPASRRRIAADLVRLTSALFVAHALWYAATGTWHGFGDGVLLHDTLGTLRHPVALVLGGGLCAVAVIATRGLCRALAPLVNGTNARRLALVLTAAAGAAAIHGALTYGEFTVRRDRTYRETMRTAEQRATDDRLARWRAEQLRRGRVPDDAETVARVRALTPPRPFPFAKVLAAVALAAVGLGARSLRHAVLPTPTGPSRPSLAALAVAFAVAAGSVLAVASLNAC
jgi:hypothetical protein